MTKCISFLIKPASAACGMRCRYCFYRDVAEQRSVAATGVMDAPISHVVIERAMALAPDAQVNFAFQGGEPTVAGLPFFEDFVSYVERLQERQRVRYSIQTNGLAVAEDPLWADFFARNRFLVGLSIDGSKENHDHLRPDAAGRGTYSRVIKALHRLQKSRVEFNVLAVLTSQLAQHPQQAFGFLLREKIEFVQYVPCLPGLREDANTYSLAPRDFARFYCRLLDQWQRELERGHYISIGLFDDVMAMTLGHQPMQCGMLGTCSPQLVVEGNGDVYPCDFYALDEWRCGNILRDSLESLVGSEVSNRFLSEPRRACSACVSCRFEGMCHRNCKRLNIAYFDNTYCGYQEFLEYGYPRLVHAARMLVGC